MGDYIPVDKFKEYIKKAKTKGQEEAWELARKIGVYESKGGYSGKQLNEIFDPHWTVNSIMANNSYAEAAEKVKKWEDSKAIKVGDEYYSKESGMKFVVTAVYDYTLYVIYADGSAGEEKPSNIEKYYTKTGRTLPVSDWLRQIGGAE